MLLLGNSYASHTSRSKLVQKHRLYMLLTIAIPAGGDKFPKFEKNHNFWAMTGRYLGKSRIFRAVIKKIWAKSGILEQWQGSKKDFCAKCRKNFTIVGKEFFRCLP